MCGLLVTGVAGTGAAEFVDVGPASGVDVDGDKDGGVAWADFNEDGFLDVAVSRTDSGGSRLFFSSGGSEPTFEDVTATHASGLTRQTMGRAMVAADLNNDGLPDLVRSGDSRIEIYLNQGPSGSPAYRLGVAGGRPGFRRRLRGTRRTRREPDRGPRLGRGRLPRHRR